MALPLVTSTMSHQPPTSETTSSLQELPEGSRIRNHSPPPRPPIESSEMFHPLDELPTADWLARGAAAYEWTLKTPTGPSSHVQVVHKALRVDPMCFTFAVIGTELHEKLWSDFKRDYRAKVDLWQSLEHANVVRVLGLGAGLNLTTELYEWGSVREHIWTKSRPYPTKLDIINDVMKGVQYLHTHNPPIVHGNLNAGKMFIDAMGTTKIGEFGLAALCDPFAAFVPRVSFSGLIRWIRPELLIDDSECDSGVEYTIESDIWALGCVLFEIIAETIPYSAYKFDSVACRSILDGERPGERGENFTEQPFNLLWPLLTKCWETHPEDRPSASTLFEEVRSILQPLEHQPGSQSCPE